MAKGTPYGYGDYDEYEYDPSQVVGAAPKLAFADQESPYPSSGDEPPSGGGAPAPAPAPPPAPAPAPAPAAPDPTGGWTQQGVYDWLIGHGVNAHVAQEEAGGLVRYGADLPRVLEGVLPQYLARSNNGTSGGAAPPGGGTGSGGGSTGGGGGGGGLGAGGSEALSLQLIQQLMANMQGMQGQYQSSVQAQQAKDEALRQSILTSIQDLIAQGNAPVGDVHNSPQATSFNAASQRAASLDRSEAAERRAAQGLLFSGPMETDINAVQDDRALSVSAYEAELTDRMLKDKKDRLEKALSLGAGIMGQDQQIAAQQQLAQLNAAIQSNQMQLQLVLGLMNNMYRYDALGYDLGGQEGAANAGAANL